MKLPKSPLAIAVAACLLSWGTAHAQHGAGPAGEARDYKPLAERTLTEEREMVKKRLAKLEAMTPEQWEEEKKKRQEFRDKWKKMTPEEREKFKQERRAKREGGAASPAPSAPPAAAGKK